jgi:hypothetical protein
MLQIISIGDIMDLLSEFRRETTYRDKNGILRHTIRARELVYVAHVCYGVGWKEISEGLNINRVTVYRHLSIMKSPSKQDKADFVWTGFEKWVQKRERI